MKRTNKKIVMEVSIVISILFILGWVMIPKYFDNQPMVRIQHNEKELWKLLQDLQIKDVAVTDDLINEIIRTDSYSFHSRSYRTVCFSEKEDMRFFQNDYDFNLKKNDVVVLIYLKLEKNNLTKEIIKDIKHDKLLLFSLFLLNYGSSIIHGRVEYFDYPKDLNLIKIIKSDKLLFRINPDRYYSVTNGLNSVGYHSVDYQGRLWRDGK